MDQFINLPYGVLASVMGALPIDVLMLLEEHPRRVCVAGGFIRALVQGEAPADIDLFIQDQDYIFPLVDDLATLREVTLESRNALTFSGEPPVQIVTRWAFDPLEHIQRFDFTIAMAVVWYDRKFHGACHERFEEDSQDRRLVYTMPEREEEPLGSVIRKDKFIAKGYKMSAYQWGKLMRRTEQRLQEAREAEGLTDMSEVSEKQWHRWALRAGGGGGY